MKLKYIIDENDTALERIEKEYEVIFRWKRILEDIQSTKEFDCRKEDGTPGGPPDKTSGRYLSYLACCEVEKQIEELLREEPNR